MRVAVVDKKSRVLNIFELPDHSKVEKDGSFAMTKAIRQTIYSGKAVEEEYDSRFDPPRGCKLVPHRSAVVGTLLVDEGKATASSE